MRDHRWHYGKEGSKRGITPSIKSEGAWKGRGNTRPALCFKIACFPSIQSSTFELTDECTVVQKSHESRRQYWATHLSIRLH